MLKVSNSWFCFIVSLFIFASTAESAEIWNQWRGPSRNGAIQDSTWSDSLSEDNLQETWSKEFGPSYSGPIVSQNLVFTTETKDSKFEVVTALDRNTGEKIWETQWEGAMMVPFFALANGSWIRATPALDENRLYVAGIRDVLICLDANTGEEIWNVDFPKSTKSKVPSFGFVSSPLVHKDAVYVQAGGGFVKLNKMTGDIIWNTLKDGGGMFGSAFSSPTISTIHGVEQLVVQTRTTLAGVSIEDGTVLWSEKIPAFRGMNILTPTVKDNLVFTSSYGGKSLLFEVNFSDERWSLNKKWEHKSQGYMSSPILIDNYIYLHMKNQRFCCLDLNTGKDLWTTKPYGKYWSMVENQGKILALDQRGDLMLIEASPEEFKLLSQTKVGDDSWAHVSIVGDEIFVRNLKELKKYKWK